MRLGPLSHKYMHARTRADTHLYAHAHTQKKHKVPLSEIKNVREKYGLRKRENKVGEMGCCLFGAGGSMGVTHKHNDSAVGANKRAK